MVLLGELLDGFIFQVTVKERSGRKIFDFPGITQ